MANVVPARHRRHGGKSGTAAMQGRSAPDGDSAGKTTFAQATALAISSGYCIYTKQHNLEIQVLIRVPTPDASRAAPAVEPVAASAGLRPRPSAHPAAILQRVRRDPRSLTRSDVTQLQRTIGNAAVGRLLASLTPPQSATGLPTALKQSVEARSGLSMDDVRVHRDSPEPAQLDALAFARGPDIHLGPGQDRHLPHEAWHVVQQKQGRVKPTTQMGGLSINDESHLEREADGMGDGSPSPDLIGPGSAADGNAGRQDLVQRRIGFEFEMTEFSEWKFLGKNKTDQTFKPLTHTKKVLLPFGHGTGAGADLGHLEVITEPLETYAEVETAMDTILTSMDGLRAGAKPIGDGRKAYDLTDDENLVAAGISRESEQHRILVADGGSAKMQATFGLALKRAPDLLRYGAQKEAKGLDIFKEGKPTLRNRLSQQMIDGAESWFENLHGFGDDHLLDATDFRSACTGLFTFIIKTMYDASTMGTLEDPKYSFPLMPRTNFKAMMLSIPGHALLSSPKMISRLMPAFEHAFSDFELDKALFPENYEIEAQSDCKEYIATNDRSTRRQFLTSIFDPNSAIDLMSPPAGYPAHTAARREGLGAYGMDERPQTALTSAASLALFELRALLGGKTVAIRSWKEKALAITQHVAEITDDDQLRAPIEPKQKKMKRRT